jgi:hypothetical protein
MRWDALPLGAKPIYGYEAKWLWDTPDHPLDLFECPANIPKELARDVRSAALSAYRILGCRDWCRVDIRCDAAGRPMVVELNPLPGILPNTQDNSCFPKAARAAGMSYDALIQTVADIAWRRIGQARSRNRSTGSGGGASRHFMMAAGRTTGEGRGRGPVERRDIQAVLRRAGREVKHPWFNWVISLAGGSAPDLVFNSRRSMVRRGTRPGGRRLGDRSRSAVCPAGDDLSSEAHRRYCWHAGAWSAFVLARGITLPSGSAIP